MLNQARTFQPTSENFDGMVLWDEGGKASHEASGPWYVEAEDSEDVVDAEVAKSTRMRRWESAIEWEYCSEMATFFHGRRRARVFRSEERSL